MRYSDSRGRSPESSRKSYVAKRARKKGGRHKECDSGSSGGGSPGTRRRAPSSRACESDRESESGRGSGGGASAVSAAKDRKDKKIKKRKGRIMENADAGSAKSGGGNQKKRLTVDYSETINRFTLLDAYPLPRINEMAQYRVFSTIDLKSAYHQITLREEDKPYTAFEADGGLYQFCRVPFGVTNGVAVFQRQMDSFVEENSLSGTFPYLDNITICGRNEIEHDENLKRFLQAAKDINLTYNEEKCEFSTRKLHILGSVLENGEIRPDPKRLEPLSQLKPPSDAKSLKRVMGFFSYYSKWIRDFSKKISLLVNVCNFPLNKEELYAFESLKREI